ncbi:MAG: hypothetical protein F6J92_21400 [Symploca sp. SIO1A3]|nr:hypothetical protein [Symploca sp. SIO1A3]
MRLDGNSSAQQGNSPIHRHVWAYEDSQAMADFRTGLNTQEKRNFSAIQGESFGHRYVEDVLGYETVFHGDEKSIRQGIDGLYFDHRTDSLVVVEFKGQGSRESTLQKYHDWTMTTCQKIDQGMFPYGQVSDYERTVARSILDHIERGQPVRYEVVRTEVDVTHGQMWSQLEKQIFLEKDLTPGQEIIPCFDQRQTPPKLEWRDETQPKHLSLSWRDKPDCIRTSNSTEKKLASKRQRVNRKNRK